MQPEFTRKKKRRDETDSASTPVGTKKQSRETAPGVPRFLKARSDSASADVAAQDRKGIGPEAASAPAKSAEVSPKSARDSHERDADRLAEQSLNSANSRTTGQLGEANVSQQSGSPVRTQSGTIAGPGDPLPEADRLHFEKSMNADFGDVRVHQDDAAAQAADNLNALAFTENRDIAFGPGQYQPATSEGRRLLAHELAHVKQQSSGEVSGVQRDPKPETETASAPPAPVEEPEGPTNELFGRDYVEGMRGRSTARYFQTSKTVQDGAQTIESIKQTLLRVSERYHGAYDNYSTAVIAAGKEARSQQRWFDFFTGVAIGVGVGLLSEWLLVAEGASLALELTVEVGAEMVEGGIVAGLKISGLTELAGQDLAPSRDLDPMVLDLKIYKLLESLHRKVFGIARYGDTQFLINGAAEYTIGEIKAHIAGGEWEMSEGDLLDLIETLVRVDQASETLDETLPALRSALKEIESGIDSAPRQPTTEIEQDIWILWMSKIKDADSDILDYDPIEDRLHLIGVLGSSSRLGIDFGWYTSGSDEEAALQAARDAAPAILSGNSKLTDWE